MGEEYSPLVDKAAMDRLPPDMPRPPIKMTTSSQLNDPPSPLQDIVGQRMYAVEFIEDYIGLKFGELTLHALSDPLILEHGRTIGRTQSGYRDALCAQIGKSVQKVEDIPEKLTIWLDETQIIIPLDVGSHPGPEMATLSGRGLFINAWLHTDCGPLPS